MMYCNCRGLLYLHSWKLQATSEKTAVFVDEISKNKKELAFYCVREIKYSYTFYKSAFCHYIHLFSNSLCAIILDVFLLLFLLIPYFTC